MSRRSTDARFLRPIAREAVGKPAGTRLSMYLTDALREGGGSGRSRFLKTGQLALLRTEMGFCGLGSGGSLKRDRSLDVLGVLGMGFVWGWGERI